MTDLRIPAEAVDAVKWFIGSRGLRLRWWKPSPDSLESVVGSERGVALVDAFVVGWLAGRDAVAPPQPANNPMLMSAQEANHEVGQRTPLQWDDNSSDPWATKPKE